MEIDLKQLRELMRAIKQFDVYEIEIESGEERIALRRGPGRGEGELVSIREGGGSVSPQSAPSRSAGPGSAGSEPLAAASAASAPAKAEDPSVAYVTSPFVGTFYRSPSPDSPPFIEPGQTFRAGQVLCIVEAMKLMNEIESDFAGTVLDVLVQNGNAVEYGDRLFKVRRT